MAVTRKNRVDEAEKAGFDALLARLDTDRARAGEKYEELRRRIIQLLAWRGSSRPEELGDEVLRRAGKNLVSGETVRNLEAYCAGIVRLVLLEDMNSRREVPLRGLDRQLPAPEPGAEDDPRLQAFDSCLARLSEDNRQLILRYYACDGGEKVRERRALARSLGIPLNALRIRAFRIRAAMERCIAGKLAGSPESEAK
jgi:DNA-directed RNA polymerase specialized sigma24 family protein